MLPSRHIDHIAAMIRAGNRVEEKTGRDQSVNTADNILEYINDVLEDMSDG